MQDGSVGKVAGYQARRPAFKPHKLGCKMRKLIFVDCPLTFTSVLWYMRTHVLSTTPHTQKFLMQNKQLLKQVQAKQNCKA